MINGNLQEKYNDLIGKMDEKYFEEKINKISGNEKINNALATALSTFVEELNKKKSSSFSNEEIKELIDMLNKIDQVLSPVSYEKTTSTLIHDIRTILLMSGIQDNKKFKLIFGDLSTATYNLLNQLSSQPPIKDLVHLMETKAKELEKKPSLPPLTGKLAGLAKKFNKLCITTGNIKDVDITSRTVIWRAINNVIYEIRKTLPKDTPAQNSIKLAKHFLETCNSTLSKNISSGDAINDLLEKLSLEKCKKEIPDNDYWIKNSDIEKAIINATSTISEEAELKTVEPKTEIPEEKKEEHEIPIENQVPSEERKTPKGNHHKRPGLGESLEEKIKKAIGGEEDSDKESIVRFNSRSDSSSTDNQSKEENYSESKKPFNPKPGSSSISSSTEVGSWQNFLRLILSVIAKVFNR